MEGWYRSSINIFVQEQYTAESLRKQQSACHRGPLSPLCANIMLNELDHELKKRGHCHVRYADYTEVETMSNRKLTLISLI